MRKHLHSNLYVLALTLCLPMSAHASLFTFDYSGHVKTIYGSGMGYELGDYLLGQLTFDLSCSTGDQFPDDLSYAQYSAREDGSSFVSGFLADIGQSGDYVRIYNGFSDPYAPPNPSVGFAVGNRTFFGGSENRSSAMELSVSLEGVNWVNNDNIRDFLFTSKDLYPGYSYGSFSSRYDYTAEDGTRWTQNNQVLFDFDIIQLTAVDVPESGTLILGAIGALALFLRRRMDNKA